MHFCAKIELKWLLVKEYLHYYAHYSAVNLDSYTLTT